MDLLYRVFARAYDISSRDIFDIVVDGLDRNGVGLDMVEHLVQAAFEFGQKEAPEWDIEEDDDEDDGWPAPVHTSDGPEVDRYGVWQIASRLGSIEFLSWGDSPQGYDYWSTVSRNLVSLSGFNPTPTSDEDYPDDLPLSEMLDSYISWDSTPQGFTYWCGVYDKLRAMGK